MADQSNRQSTAFAALRIVSGFMFFWHGAQKILGVLTDYPRPSAFSQMWFGGIIELVCGVLICIGLFTRPAALLASGTMAVAYFQFNWKLALDGSKFLPIVNGGELAVLYCFAFLMFAALGPGPYSFDARRGRA
ncbi:MAG TPA: DoxX family protein [Kofleriaceae bacterium]|jgi:putative oxidoreductase